jgi:hypothetical protein
MTAHLSSASRLTGYTLAVAVIAAIVVAGSVRAYGNEQQASVAPATVRIHVAALLSNTEIANLPYSMSSTPVLNRRAMENSDGCLDSNREAILPSRQAPVFRR